MAEPILFRILPSKLREQNPYKLKVQRGKENKHEHVKKIQNTLLYLFLRLQKYDLCTEVENLQTATTKSARICKLHKMHD